MKTTKRLVLGEGETFGHKHVLQSDRYFHYLRENKSLQFSLTHQGTLTHDEHDRIVFEAGNFHTYHQVEFNPMDGTTSNVFD